MDGYISINQLGILIVFLVVMVVSGYLILTLRNVNSAAKDMGLILKTNQDDLCQAISNIAKASANMVDITHDLRTSLGETGGVIETADKIATYAVVIGETAKTLASFFSSFKKD